MEFFNMFRDETEFETYEDGEWVFVEGQPGDVMYVIKAGKIDIMFEDNVLETIPTGGILGEMALVGYPMRSANAIARGHCELVPVNEERFHHLIQNTPGFATSVMKVMADRLRNRTFDAS